MREEIMFDPRGVNKVLRLLQEKLPAVLHHYFYIHNNRFKLWVSHLPYATSIIFSKEDLSKTPEEIVDDILKIIEKKIQAVKRKEAHTIKRKTALV